MFKQSGDTILFVEDEESAILLVQQAVVGCLMDIYLAVVFYTVAALEWLSTETAHGHPIPRMILSDLKLPKLIGLAEIRTLRTDSRLQNVLIVAYSEVGAPSDDVLAYQIGANYFAKKPESLPELSQLLHDLIELVWLSEKRIGSSLKQTIIS